MSFIIKTKLPKRTLARLDFPAPVAPKITTLGSGSSFKKKSYNYLLNQIPKLQLYIHTIDILKSKIKVNK